MCGTENDREMPREEDTLLSAPFMIESLEEAATKDFSNLWPELHNQDKNIRQFFQASYLSQVYKVIQITTLDKKWVPMDATLLCRWEDNLWDYFICHYQELSKFIPNCKKSGYNIACTLWIVLCGLNLLNHYWRKETPWKKLYNEGGKGSDLNFVKYKFLLLHKKPVIAHSTSELMGELFVLSTKFYDLEYHPELEIWISWLQTRTAELMYMSCESKEIFDSAEWCAPRSQAKPNHPLFKASDPKYNGILGVSDSFDQETCRLFFEMRNAIYRYKYYPRHLVTCLEKTIGIRDCEMDIPKIDSLDLPLIGSFSFEDCNARNLFFETKEQEKFLKERWANFVMTELKMYYHDRTKRTLSKIAMFQLLNLGESYRSASTNQGIPVDAYECLKKNRNATALDHVDYHTFNFAPKQVVDFCIDLDRERDRVKDMCLLYLVEQYMHRQFKIRFIADYVKTERDLINGFRELEIKTDPMIIQTMGGYDVYHKGQVFQTRNVARAFLVWCYRVLEGLKETEEEGEEDQSVFSILDISNMFRLLFEKEETQNEDDMEEETLNVENGTSVEDRLASYWL